MLDREMYAEAEAARLLRVPQPTLHYWLEGGERRGKLYRPIIRVEPTGMRIVTWAEFVEAALLREYRRRLNVPMTELRNFIDRLRDGLGMPYPLAHHRPYVADRQLVYDAQTEAGLDPDFALVAMATGQLVLTGASQSFLERVTWDGDIAAGWRPDADPGSPVAMVPDVRFGRPAVNGVSTEAIWEQSEAGEPVDALAEIFGLSVKEIRWALAYETSQQAQSAA
jgi:uncharacterized protein (DUF433 family)/DNA-binding transcriptional MerR regulator